MAGGECGITGNGLAFATGAPRLGSGRLLLSRTHAGRGQAAYYRTATLAGGATGPVFELWALDSGAVQAGRLLHP